MGDQMPPVSVGRGTPPAMWLTASLLAVALLAGFGTGLLPAGVQGVARAVGLAAPQGQPTVDPAIFERPANPSAVDLSPVLTPIEPGAEPRGSLVADRVRKAGKVDGQLGALVVDDSGESLYAAAADRPLIPASTLKLLTAAGVLELLGPRHRFTTAVVARPGPEKSGPGRSGAAESGPPKTEPAAPTAGPPERIFLVGGGDPYLASEDQTGEDRLPRRGSIADLAKQSAARLRAAGAKKVDLSYDASRFSGPAWNASWPAGYRDAVTPVSALWLDSGYQGDQRRPKDPARAAAQAFAKSLAKNGIAVGAIDAGRSPVGAEPIAEVTSMPLSIIVERMISASDNNAAEVLLRHIGIADGSGGSFDGGAAGLAATLQSLGVWSDDVVIADGSGLSRANRIPAQVLVGVVALGVTGSDKLRPLATGMSVAGAEGTLRVRFVTDGTEAGRGEVRAKSGTLRQVSALAGYLVDDDGSILIFAFTSNGGGGDKEYANRTAIEKMASALASCGCR